MAPSKKSSTHKRGQATASNAPATSRNARQPRRRSASPPNEPTPLGIRDEPPARSTRSHVSAPPISTIPKPTAEQQNPIDCPHIRCRASTVHQHLPQLQYYHPHPDRATDRAKRYRGYENSSSHPRSRGVLRPVSHHGSPAQGSDAVEEEAAESVEGTEEQGLLPTNREHDIQEEPVRDMEESLAQGERSPEEMSGVEELPGTLDAPMTPPPRPSTAAAETPSPNNSISSSETPEQQQQSSAGPPIQFGDYLPHQNPTATPSNNNLLLTRTYTTEELHRPLVNPYLEAPPGMEGVMELYREIRESPARPSRTTSMFVPSPEFRGGNASHSGWTSYDDDDDDDVRSLGPFEDWRE